jgi:hypothetical protein
VGIKSGVKGADSGVNGGRPTVEVEAQNKDKPRLDKIILRGFRGASETVVLYADTGFTSGRLFGVDPIFGMNTSRNAAAA